MAFPRGRGYNRRMRPLRVLVVLLLPASLVCGAGPAWADPALKVSRKDCQRAVAHQPSGDVAYKPGVDVHGRKVRSADAGGTAKIDLPEEITIPITMDIAKKYGFGDSGKNYFGETSVGKVTVRGDRVFWNGKPLDDQDQAAVIAACKQAAGK